jgi:hypothetical protein
MFNLTHLGLYPRGKIQCNICFIGENLPKSKTIFLKILQRVIFLITIEIGHIECTNVHVIFWDWNWQYGLEDNV